MGVGLADQDEGEAFVQQQAAERLVAVQVVAEDGRLEPGDRRAVGGQPALGGGEFTVLLGRAVLGCDELRGQCDDFVAAGLDQHRRQRRMEIGHLAVGVPSRRTPLAMNGRRREMFRPIEGQQQCAIDRTVGIHHPGLLQGIEQESIRRLERLWRRGVEQGADVIVRRDLMDAKQRPGVVVALRLLQAALVLQERGALREEHREGAQRRVDHRVGLVLALPGVKKRLEGATHLLRDAVQGQGVGAKRRAQ